MNYATIVIPTLNRAGHLKRCLDSLANNGWAKYSPLIISVDYPPSPKFEAGYHEVIRLLSEYDFSSFKSIEIIYQKRNLGPDGNTMFLFSRVDEKKGMCVFTEDDNQFSPNFLEYINKGLDLFGDNDCVFSVNGMSDTEWHAPKGDNVIFSKLFPAYGAGFKLSKKFAVEEEARRFLLDKNNITLGNIRTLYRKNKYLFVAYITQILCTRKGLYWSKDGLLNMSDIPVSIYMHLTDYVCVVPVVSKSRTFGNDGSGVNMPSIKESKEKIIDEDAHFDFVCSGNISFDDRNYKIGERFLMDSLWKWKTLACSLAKAFFYLCLLYMMGKNHDRLSSILDRFQNINLK